MRPEKSEVADPRFSKSTALALEKQARERERERGDLERQGTMLSGWPHGRARGGTSVCGLLLHPRRTRDHKGKSQLGEAGFKWACGRGLTGYVYKGAQLTEDGQDGFAR